MVKRLILIALALLSLAGTAAAQSEDEAAVFAGIFRGKLPATYPFKYNGTYFWTATVRPEDGYLEAWMAPPNRDYICQGFIYNDVEPIPGEWGPWTLINYLRRQRERRRGIR